MDEAQCPRRDWRTCSVRFCLCITEQISIRICSYLVGLRSRASNTLTLRDAPVHFITRDVKRLKHINADVSGPSAEKTTQRAPSLTRAFGTKKSLRAVRVRERNEVNVASMVGVLEHLNEGVEEKTGSLPSVGKLDCTAKHSRRSHKERTTDHAKEILDSSRLIPRFNQNADKPEDVYPPQFPGSRERTIDDSNTAVAIRGGRFGSCEEAIAVQSFQVHQWAPSGAVSQSVAFGNS